MGDSLPDTYIHVAALMETSFAGEWQLTELGAGYTFFWSGHKQEVRREAGFGI